MQSLLLSIVAVVLLFPLQLVGNNYQQGDIPCGQEVIVQADDWLSKIAEKHYGNVLAYPAIAEATNAKSITDATFAVIESLDVIEIGWKLCLPSEADTEALLQQYQADVTVPAVTTTEAVAQPVGRLVLATTTSTENSGLLKAILPDFEARYGAAVEVIAVGTGQAIELGKNGDADVLLVHARPQEDAFVAEGFGVNRQDVMYNDFVILGPANDPAGIKGLTDVVAALEKIAQSQAAFISRGDDSGTHLKEQTLWQASTVPLVEGASLNNSDQTVVKPEGEWYQSVGQGMGATLTIANEQQAYTLSDRATYLARTLEGFELPIMVEGDSRLFNPYGVIAVNPALHPAVNANGTAAFIDWLTSVEAQQQIAQFGVAEFGSPLFVPDSTAWNAATE